MSIHFDRTISHNFLHTSVPFDLGHKQFLTTHVTSSELLSLDYSKSLFNGVTRKSNLLYAFSIFVKDTPTFVKISVGGDSGHRR